MVREEQPEFILAIGADALQRVKKIRNIPIIYTMVLNPEKIAGAASNITGVSMNIPLEKYLGLMEKLNLPKLRVGLFYDPAQSEELLKRIQHSAQLKGIEITAKEVHKWQEVPDLLNKMKGSFTLFWMLPDPMIVTPEIVKHLLLYAQRNGVPIVTFAGKYVDQGALISLEIDSFDMGQQAGEMANRVLDGTLASSIPNAEARKGVMKINRAVASTLGINLNSLENSMNVNQALSSIPGNN
jgi:putative ABC transport system substrate-binding protein